MHPGAYRTSIMAQRATSAIPSVMIASRDPRVLGVTSLVHPGGNLTGLTIGEPEVTSDKRLQLIKEALPTLPRVAVLWDVKRSANSGASVDMMAAAARVLGLRHPTARPPPRLCPVVRRRRPASLRTSGRRPPSARERAVLLHHRTRAPRVRVETIRR